MGSELSQRGAAARERLLTAARAELASTGDLEVSAVARRAGTSAGLPYRYFGTRGGMLVAVVEDFWGRMAQACLMRRYSAPTWFDREHQRVTDWVQCLYADPLSVVVLTGLTGDSDVSAAEARLISNVVDAAADNIAHGQRTGEIPAGRDPEMLAAATLGGLHAMVLVALTRTPQPSPESVRDEVWAFVISAVGLSVDARRES
jgi:AcrR family transcriptional regulator